MRKLGQAGDEVVRIEDGQFLLDGLAVAVELDSHHADSEGRFVWRFDDTADVAVVDGLGFVFWGRSVGRDEVFVEELGEGFLWLWGYEVDQGAIGECITSSVGQRTRGGLLVLLHGSLNDRGIAELVCCLDSIFDFPTRTSHEVVLQVFYRDDMSTRGQTTGV